MSAEDWAARLASGVVIDDPVALVVAHPDDETLWAGAALRRLSRLTLVMVTDGAPEDQSDARRRGFATRTAYARCRKRELTAALAALGVQTVPIRYEVCDQKVVERLPEVIQRLEQDLAGAALVLTHPYEGGHPDHDAVALAVHRAAACPIVEFACYAQFDGLRAFAQFVPSHGSPEHTRALSPGDRKRVEAALAAHASQADVFGDWRPAAEHWRAAPAYDFSAPPPGEAVLYDSFGWRLTGARWRDRVAASGR